MASIFSQNLLPSSKNVLGTQRWNCRRTWGERATEVSEYDWWGTIGSRRHLIGACLSMSMPREWMKMETNIFVLI